MNTNDVNLIEEIYRDSFSKFEDLYDYFFHNCEFQILISKLSLGYDAIRIRDYNDLSEITKKDHVKYAPTSTSFSRIGKPNQIWFYVSDDLSASLAEMLPNWFDKIRLGDKVKIIISTWHIRQEIKVVLVPDFSNINDTCRMLDLETYRQNQIFWSYISNKFRTCRSQSKNIHEFTSAFANALIDKAKLDDKNIDGIFYPSVQYPCKSNLALAKSTVDSEKIVLKSLFKTAFFKSRILNSNGTPNYYPISDFEQGYYDPDKDIISWN